MGTFLHFKNIYQEAFSNCHPGIVVTLLKAYSIFCGIMLSIALYAFTYRVVTGFEF